MFKKLFSLLSPRDAKLERICSEMSARFREQVLSPDYEGYEKFYGCEVLPELRRFYELGEQLLGTVLYVTYESNHAGVERWEFCQHPQPLKEEIWAHSYGRDYFWFAVNTDGYPLLIMPHVINSPVFADWNAMETDPDIGDLGFTLAEVVGTIGPKSRL